MEPISSPKVGFKRQYNFGRRDNEKDPLDKDSRCPECNTRATRWSSLDDGTPYFYCMRCGTGFTIEELATYLALLEGEDEDDG